MRVYHEGFRAPIKMERFELSDDPDKAVAGTIALMARFVRQDRGSPILRHLSRELCSNSQRVTMERVWHWIRGRVRFVHDEDLLAQLHLPAAVNASGFANDVAEVLIRPVDMLRMYDAQGDCDDFSMLGACLLTACGIPCEFVTVAGDAREPTQYSHVYVRAAGVPFDSSHGPVIGWQARNRFGKLERWDVETGLPRSMMIRLTGVGGRGLGDCDYEGDPTCEVPSGSGDGSTITLPNPFGVTNAPSPAPSSSCDPNNPDPLSIIFGGCSLPTSIPSGGGGSIPTTSTPQSPTPYWATDLNSVITGALTILKAQYAVPPPGTLITTRSGNTSSTIATGLNTSALSTSTLFGSTSSSSSLLVIAAVVVLVILLLGRKK